MARGFTPVYFTDENALGLGKLLQRKGRDDVLYPGHEILPEIPLGTLDVDWMRVVGARGYILGAGPWALALSASGVRPLAVKEIG